ncbi:MAG: N-formylglutamate amidohydrolase [Gammaproteobacteria bacterium]
MIPSIVETRHPRGNEVPVVLDSPHSGRIYPADFGHAMSPERVRRLEDAYVDHLFADATLHGATLVRALFPRSYIDVNRAPDDIDEALLDAPWPEASNPGPKVRLGIGLIAKRDVYGFVYDRMLRPSELRQRLDGYYWPYHRALQTALDGACRREGAVWHLNCHSMRSVGVHKAVSNSSSGDRSSAERRVDFCLGDRMGESCGSEFTALVADTLRELGYSVAVNEPYSGVELVRRYAAPARNRHSLQIEINRALYMDERRVCRHSGYETLRRDLGELVERVCDYARELVRPASREAAE